MSLIDDFSRMTWIYFLNKKSEVFERFLEFKAQAKNETNRKIKVLRTDTEESFLEKRLTSSVNIMV